MKFPRRRFLHLAANAVALPAMSRIARAQTYPSRTVTMIVPFAAGGPTDVSARIVAERMSRTLGQQIIIENVLGAGGTTGSIRAMRANPDGYTIEMGQLGTHAASAAFYPNLALFAPKGTPQPLLDTLTAALDKALDDDTVRKRLSDLGCEIPDKSQTGRWRSARHWPRLAASIADPRAFRSGRTSRRGSGLSP
jgi:tripartite-type tricarboxylate transporter receptor subunit TctC